MQTVQLYVHSQKAAFWTPQLSQCSKRGSIASRSIMSAETQKAQEGQSGQQLAGKAITAHPPRATDAFYAKLLPALEVSLHLPRLIAFPK